MVSHFRSVISHVQLQFSEVNLTLPLQGTCYVWSLSSGVGTSLITLTPPVKKNAQKRYVHLSVDSVQTPGKSHVYILTCICTYMVSLFRNVISHAQFPGVTFRNVICHCNFCKYDDVAPWCKAVCMLIPSSTSEKHCAHVHVMIYWNQTETSDRVNRSVLLLAQLFMVDM